MNKHGNSEKEQLCVVVLYMLECNAADVQPDASNNLMVNRKGCDNNTMYCI